MVKIGLCRHVRGVVVRAGDGLAQEAFTLQGLLHTLLHWIEQSSETHHARVFGHAVESLRCVHKRPNSFIKDRFDAEISFGSNRNAHHLCHVILKSWSREVMLHRRPLVSYIQLRRMEAILE